MYGRHCTVLTREFGCSPQTHTHKKGSSVLHNARNSNGIPVALFCVRHCKLNLRHCKLAMGLIRLDVRQTLHRPHESLAVHLKHTLTRKVQASYIMQETAMAFLLRSVAHSRCYRCFFLYIWSVIDEEFISELSFLQPKECLVEMVLSYLSLSSGWAPLKRDWKNVAKMTKELL